MKFRQAVMVVVACTVMLRAGLPLQAGGGSVPSNASKEATVPEATLTFSQLRERGRRAYRAKRYSDARNFWSAAAALKPDDAATFADLAVALQHLNETDHAVQANRDAIRVASAKGGQGDRAVRIRRASYFNLGQLRAAREILFVEANDGPSSCIELASESGCSRPVFACGREGSTGGAHGGFDNTTARFALDRETARIVEGDEFVSGFDRESWADLGDTPERTRDHSDASSYDVTLSWSSELREPSPGEADITVAREENGCAIVHVDACARRLGLYCEWRASAKGAGAKRVAKAVELSFAPAKGPYRR